MPNRKELGEHSGDQRERLTIEERGVAWERSRRERILRGEERGIRIIKREAEAILSLPALSGHARPRAPEVRIHDLGIIHTSRWSPKDVFLVNERLTIENPQNYIHLRSRGERHVDLADLHQVALTDRPVVELIFGKIDSDIETAIRQQFHILEGYKPGTKAAELEQAKKAAAYIRRQSLKFIGGGLTKEDLGNLLGETTNFLKESGFLSTRVHEREKKKITNMLLRAMKPDSLERVNPMIARVRLRAGWLAAMRRVVVSSLIIKKAEDNLRLLLWEREMTRWALEMAREDLATLAGLEGKRGGVVFWQEGAMASKKEIMGMIKVLESIAGKKGLLSIPRVVDYIGPAKLAAINLLGVSAVKDLDLTRQIIGSETVVNEFLRLSPVPVLLHKRQFAKGRDRIRWSHAIINAVLADYASIEKIS